MLIDCETFGSLVSDESMMRLIALNLYTLKT